MEVKKIVEGMTAPQVAQVIDENFNALNGEKATVEAVADVQKNVNRSDDNTGILSYPVFDDTEPVAVGDVRRYEGLLYRAKEAGAHDWDPEKWERVTLKQLVDEKLSELGSEVSKIYNGNYSLADFNDRYYIDVNGKITANDYFRVLPFVPVSKGDVVTTIGVTSDNQNVCCIAAYKSDGTFIKENSIFYQSANQYEYVVGDDITYLAFGTLLTKTNVSIAIKRDTALETLRIDINKLQDEIQHLSMSSEDFTKEIFIEASGKEVYNASYRTTDFILIKGIKSLKVKAVMGNQYGGGVAFYDKSQKFISSIYNTATTEIEEYQVSLNDIPSNAWYIKVQGVKIRTDLFVNYAIAPNVETNALLQYNKSLLWERKKAIYSDSAESLAVNDYLIIEDSPNIRNGYIIHVSAKVNSMGRVRISKGTGAYAAGIVDIDANNIFEYNPNNPTAYNTYEHGLAISDFIRVTILVSDAPMTATITGKAKMIVESVGGRYEKDIIWNGGNNNIVFFNTSANLTNAEITLSIKGKDVWYFGDSYLDFWTPYAYKLGGSNILIDGYSGRASEAAYISLLREGLTNLPKKIVWGMGMNDGDNTDSVNSNWNYYYEQVMAFCNEYGIELILVTIPNTPTVNNFYKNQIIRESGCRYLDVAKLMGAENKSSSWYSGLMSSDNVHPTDLGAKILATYIVSQLAEIK